MESTFCFVFGLAVKKSVGTIHRRLPGLADAFVDDDLALGQPRITQRNRQSAATELLTSVRNQCGQLVAALGFTSLFVFCIVQNGKAVFGEQLVELPSIAAQHLRSQP